MPIIDKKMTDILKEKFGFSTFRAGQKEIIYSLLNGENMLAVLPTGQGKSLCYQLTGYLLKGSVLIISPLISLMEDQVNQLQQLGEKKVIALNSTLSRAEKEWVLKNLAAYKFIFLSPEMLTQSILLQKMKQMDISLLVIDEAHCVSLWGNDFRPEYRQIGKIVGRLGLPRLLALTATATPRVIADIKDSLFNEKFRLFQQSVERENIAFFVEKTTDKKERLKALLKEAQPPGIVYCSTRKQVEELYQEVASEHSIGYYHGGLSAGQRKQLQQQFTNGKISWLIATNAFGMGINKADIRTIIHYDLSDSLENYMQEVGRAGRDGKLSQALLLYAAGDEHVYYFFQRNLREQRIHFEQLLQKKGYNMEAAISGLQEKWLEECRAGQDPKQLFQRLKIHEKEKEKNLQSMLKYIHFEGCRQAFILRYFEEQPGQPKKHCCDYHGERLLLHQSGTNPAAELLSWQEILLKLFKEKKKVNF